MTNKKFTAKCTKILVTVGATDGNGSREIISDLIHAGANGLRINFSHAKYDEVKKQIKWIRQIANEVGRNVSILADLQGPKIRLGNLQNDMRYDIKKGDVIGLEYNTNHDGGSTLPTQYDLSTKVKVGERLFLFDGKISAEIVSIDGKTVKIKTENDGFVTSRKGINLPDTDFGGDILTDKDLEDLEFAMGQDFDYVGLSFIHTADDVRKVRQVLKDNNSDMKIISKIETREAIADENMEEIIKVSDGVMVARGDLAYEVGAEVVPVVRRHIVELCQKHCKFSIVATQMMGSMVDNPQPTRAEASDVATAAMEGVDVVMLSEETAVGSYPVAAVAEMRKILVYIQENLPVAPIYKREGGDKRRDAIGESVVMLAERLDADAIIVESLTGNMACNVAIHRPSMRVIAVSGSQRVAQQLPLIYGTRSYYAPDIQAGYGSTLAEKLFEQGYFGDKEVTLVIVGSSDPSFPLSVADTISVKTIK